MVIRMAITTKGTSSTMLTLYMQDPSRRVVTDVTEWIFSIKKVYSRILEPAYRKMQTKMDSSQATVLCSLNTIRNEDMNVNSAEKSSRSRTSRRGNVMREGMWTRLLNKSQ